MSLPYTAFDAVTSAGTSPARDLERLSQVHTMIVTATGDPTIAVVNLQLSHDGVHWVGTSVSLDASVGPVVGTASGHLARFVRAYLPTLSGGTSPTVTASIASS